MKRGQTIELGRRSPWWGGRKEGTSDLKHSWSQFLVGFIHPVWWHPPDDGRLCQSQLLVGFVKQGGGEEEPKEVWGTRLAMTVVEVTGTCAGGRQSKQHLGGGSSLHSTFFITRAEPKILKNPGN